MSKKEGPSKTRLIGPEDPRILRPDPVSAEWDPHLEHQNNTPIPTSAPHPLNGQQKEQNASPSVSTTPPPGRS